MPFEIREITDLEEMVQQLPLLQLLTPSLEPARYRTLLEQMLLNKYRMVAIFENSVCVGLSGFWISAKLYSGKYLEVDNFVVEEKYRSQRIGKQLLDWLTAEAQRHHCETLMLDAYAGNHAAHRFYFREGFIIKGFHFLKRLS